MNNAIWNYLKAKSELEKMFATSIYYDVEYSENEWSYSDGELSWSDIAGDYSEEARYVAESEDHTLFLIYSCTGDKYLKIMKVDKEV